MQFFGVTMKNTSTQTARLDEISKPALPGPNPGVTHYHVQANANCYAVADLVVAAKDERQAKRKAQRIFDKTSLQVTGNTPPGRRCSPASAQENVEIDILQIQDHDSELPPVENDALRARTEVEMGRLLF